MTKRNRIIYTILFILLVSTEVLIALYVHDRIIRPYVGDVLVTILLGALVRTIIPTKTRLLSLYIFVFALTVEVCQYFDYAKLLGLNNIKFFSVILGNSFSFIDILCYAIGCVMFWFIEHSLNKTSDKNP